MEIKKTCKKFPKAAETGTVEFEFNVEKTMLVEGGFGAYYIDNISRSKKLRKTAKGGAG